MLKLSSLFDKTSVVNVAGSLRSPSFYLSGVEDLFMISQTLFLSLPISLAKIISYAYVMLLRLSIMRYLNTISTFNKINNKKKKQKKNSYIIIKVINFFKAHQHHTYSIH